MTTKYFCDLLFHTLNENDAHFRDIEWIDSENCFIITCSDNTKFSLSIYNINIYCMNLSHNTSSQRQTEIQKYVASHTREDYIHDLVSLRKDNPYLFTILLAVLKLRELDIISHDMAESVMTQLQAYEQKLKDDWDLLL